MQQLQSTEVLNDKFEAFEKIFKDFLNSTFVSKFQAKSAAISVNKSLLDNVKTVLYELSKD